MKTSLPGMRILYGLLLAFSTVAAAEERLTSGQEGPDIEYRLVGHLKAQLNGLNYPKNSLYRELHQRVAGTATPSPQPWHRILTRDHAPQRSIS